MAADGLCVWVCVLGALALQLRQLSTAKVSEPVRSTALRPVAVTATTA